MGRIPQVAPSSWITQYLYIFNTNWRTYWHQCFHNNSVPSYYRGNSDTFTQLPKLSRAPSSTLHQEPHSQSTTLIPRSQEAGERSAVFFAAPAALTQHTIKILKKVITADDPWSIYQVELHQKHMKVCLNSCIVPSSGADFNPGWLKISCVKCYLQVTPSPYWLLTPPCLTDKAPAEDILYSLPSWLSRHTMAVTEAWTHVSTKSGYLSLELIKVSNFMEMTSNPHPQHPTASAAQIQPLCCITSHLQLTQPTVAGQLPHGSLQKHHKFACDPELQPLNSSDANMQFVFSPIQRHSNSNVGW